ncbi:P-loop NTPase fold protein [Bacillaceae bacterium CLA-AA-H227]|uniref:P-loop NTPase fold protein n=1 Tax=Robertmurraya yapensis (ex Hitch et al 2024) TaxID=3133160 RepID=A0ACC6S912_9BACI
MKYIIDSVISYLKQENTSYTLLLNGKWGSGKTYFFEKKLKPAIENEDFNGKKKKTIYLSLYGVSSLDEINKRIVLDNFLMSNDKVMDFLDNKWGGRVTELAKAGFGYLKSLEIPFFKNVLDSSVNYENLLDFTDKVLCIDDLERAKMDITDILGYINNFVEHDGVKVIIIGYEDEIAEKLNNRNLELKMLVSTMALTNEGSLSPRQITVSGNKAESPAIKQIEEKMSSLFHKSNEYKRIKEKLIGKTLTLQLDYQEVLNDIIGKIQDGGLQDFLIENSETIFRKFIESDSENIRILKQGLDDFEIIFHKFQEDYCELGEEVLISILVYTLASTFEIKSGAKGNEDLDGATDDILFLIGFNSYNNKTEKTYLEMFIEKYHLTSKKVKGARFFKFAEKLVRKGIFDLELFEEEMGAIKRKSVQATPMHIRLIREGYRNLTDEEFEKGEKETYEKLINGQVSFVLYLEAFILFRHLIEKGLFKKKVDEVKNEFMKGLNTAAAVSDYYTNMDTYFIGSNLDNNDQDAMTFKSRIIEINQKLLNKKNAKQTEDLMACLLTDFPKFIHDMREKYFYIPVFNNYDMQQLFNNIVSLSNQDTFTFVLLLENRYKHEEDVKNHKLYLEKENLTLLKNIIDEYISGKELTLKLSILQEVSDAIEEVIEKL